jgi:hypothetical protein
MHPETAVISFYLLWCCWGNHSNATDEDSFENVHFPKQLFFANLSVKCALAYIHPQKGGDEMVVVGGVNVHVP